jgi:predicted amidohydrolase YtcJ
MQGPPESNRSLKGQRSSGPRSPASRYDGAPDLVLHNARIHVVDAEGSTVDALAIKQQRIVAIGGAAAVRRLASRNTRQVDLGGRTVIPGFVDGHPHLDTVALKLARPSFEGVKSIDDVLDIVGKAVAQRAPGERLVCNPLAEEPDVFRMPGALREGRWPTRHDLDRVAPNHPVVIPSPILVAPGVAIVNTAALDAAGIGRNTSAPEGVEIDRDERGEATGVFRDFTFPKRVERTFFPWIFELSDDELTRALRAGVHAFNAAGVTAIYEGHGLPPGPQRAYLRLWDERALTVRTYFVIQFPPALFDDPRGADAFIAQTARYAGGQGFGDETLRFGGLGFSFDSASAIGASLMREPYVGARGVPWTGVQHTSDAKFRDVLFKVARAGLRAQVQAAGGAAIDKVLAMYEEIDREAPLLGKRWVIEHCQFPSPGNMATCRRLGVIPTSTTNFLWLHGSIYVRCFGRKLAEAAVPFKAWLDAGVPVVQSTDGRPYRPLFAYWQSLARRDGLTGEVLGTAGQKLSRLEALRLYTTHGAAVAFWDDRLGSLEAGKLADLVVLSDDIMTIDEDRIPETRVLATLVGGRPLHDTGLFEGVADSPRTGG